MPFFLSTLVALLQRLLGYLDDNHGIRAAPTLLIVHCVTSSFAPPEQFVGQACQCMSLSHPTIPPRNRTVAYGSTSLELQIDSSTFLRHVVCNMEPASPKPEILSQSYAYPHWRSMALDLISFASGHHQRTSDTSRQPPRRRQVECRHKYHQTSRRSPPRAQALKPRLLLHQRIPENVVPQIMLVRLLLR